MRANVRTLASTLLLTAFGVACGEGGEPAFSSQADNATQAEQGAPCAPDELSQVETCARAQCDGLSGEELSGCVFFACAAPIETTLSGTCQGCVSSLIPTGGVDTLVNACTQAPPEGPVCPDPQFGQADACARFRCGDLFGQELANCALTLCGAEIGGLPGACLDCVLGHTGEGIDGINAACAPPPPPVEEASCKIFELQRTEACALEHCGDLPNDQLAVCAFNNCSDELRALSPACFNCASQHQADGLDGIVEACDPVLAGGVQPCPDDEFDPADACAREHCAGLSGDALFGCALSNCGAQISSVSQLCLSCILDHVDTTIEGIASFCNVPPNQPPPPPPPPPVCASLELAPTDACVRSNCAGVSDDQLAACAFNACQAQLLALSGPCLSCVSQHQNEGIDGVVAACDPSLIPPPVCSDAEFDPADACARAQCAGLVGNALLNCTLIKCGTEIGQMSEACLDCVIEHRAAGIDGIADACH